MLKIHTRVFPAEPTPLEDFLPLVMTALEAKGLVPAKAPDLPLPDHINRANFEALVCEKIGGQWSAFIYFKNAPDGAPNCIGLPPEMCQATAIEAFMTAVKFVCIIATGDDELPFFAVGDMLMFVTYGPAPAEAGGARA
ncbi:hypothetical protein GQE99_12290 [Maritimibacter sp. DP07]|uniref:Uncharacterized protein n=1 Tax=Maritimibacter harenae TaxID=2606218 RepID=A0A845M8B0_9RHOB|nr:hypothetical protein [Maritimibacter harenae]MZR13793.1 hypothetical protein [Maritimibacter harenae]